MDTNSIRTSDAILINTITMALSLAVGVLIGSAGLSGDFPNISRVFLQRPELLSATGTLGLVLLTGVYTLQTRKLVQAEYETRQQERVESWYGETITTVRQIERNWRFLLRHRAPRGVVQLSENEGLYRELDELSDQLDSQIAGRPEQIDEGIVRLADDFLESWKQLSASEDPQFDYNHDGINQLVDLRSAIENQSSWYG